MCFHASGSGYIKITDMMKAGFALNVFGVVFITLSIYFLLPIMWDIDLNSVPEMFKVMYEEGGIVKNDFIFFCGP